MKQWPEWTALPVIAFKKMYFLVRILGSKAYDLYQTLHDDKKVIRSEEEHAMVLKTWALLQEGCQVTDFLFLGNACNALDYDFLTEQKIQVIINTTQEIPNFFEHEFTYLHIPLRDYQSESLEKWFPLLEDKVVEYKDKRVLVHCYMGSSRSVAVATFWLWHLSPKSMREILNDCKNLRWITNVNQKFIDDLLLYEGTHKKLIYNEVDKEV